MRKDSFIGTDKRENHGYKEEEGYEEGWRLISLIWHLILPSVLRKTSTFKKWKPRKISIYNYIHTHTHTF